MESMQSKRSVSDERTEVSGAGRALHPAPAVADGAEVARVSRRHIGAALSPTNIGAVYVLVLICVIFSLWMPQTFPTVATVKQILDGNAITALAGLGLVIPLAARTFDLSFAYTMSLSGVTAAHFVVSNHLGVGVATILGVGVALIIGLINAVVVVVMRIDSFIGTLATGSLVQAFITYFTGDTTINDARLSQGFSKLAQGQVAGFIYPVFYALGLAIVLWLFLEYTPTGRRLYATGFNIEAAKLANIRTARLRFCSLLASSVIAGFAGVVLASSISSGSPVAGTSYLLPAFAVVFVGATQFKRGRFNAWGTVVAVLMLGTGVTGLGLASAPAWSGNIFTGVVLIIALSATGVQRRHVRAADGATSASRLGQLGQRLRIRSSG
jgi:ribose transport system permease protein